MSAQEEFNQLVADTLSNIQDEMSSLRKGQEKFSSALNSHIKDEAPLFEYVRSKLQEQQDKNELRKEVLKKVAAGGVWTAVVVMATYVWDFAVAYFKHRT